MTGASGLLGTWLRRTAPAGVEIVPLVHRTRTGDPGEQVADLRDAGTTADAFVAVRPDLVIHAAYAKDEASIVDATAHVVAGCLEIGAELVHVSTDAVFSGDGRRRAEDAVPDPIADYGRWKAAAEDLVRERLRATAIIRLPLIVSIEPPDTAVTAIVEGATTGRPTTWFVDELRHPARADEIADAIWRIAGLDTDRRAGSWHLPGPERLSRHDIALRILAALDFPGEVIVAAPAAGVRPRDLRLTDDRARHEIGWSPSPVLT